MKKTLLLLLFAYFENSFAAVDQAQQQNSICYVKTNAPELVFGDLPFSCDKKPDKFVAHVQKQIEWLSQTTIIPNLKSCLRNLFDTKNMVNVARGVWDLRDSPVMSTNAATALAISEACKIIGKTSRQDQTKPNLPTESENTLPRNVAKTWSYKPFAIVSSSQKNK